MNLYTNEICFVSSSPEHTGGERESVTLIAMAALTVVFLLATLAPASALGQDPSLIQPYQQFEAATARGDYATAIEFGRLALNRAEQQYGTESVDIVGTLEMLGEALVQVGNYDEAVRHYTRVLQIKERVFGPGHPELISALEALADVRWQQGNFSAAESLLERVLNIEEAVYGETHEDVVITWTRLRDLYVAAGRPEDVARVDAKLQSLSIRTRNFGLLADDGAQSLDTRRYSTADGFATVRVYYGTNRARSGNDKASQFYGGERGELEVGYLDVSIPALHKYGELETSSRWSIFTYGLGEDALKRKYVLLLNVEPMNGENFYTNLSEHIQNSPSNDIFMFVHGYNSSFEDAARRTAQLAYDLDFDGTPMLYSWPSQGTTTAYTVDEAAVRVGGRKMARFLTNIVQQAGADRIHLIAHSMGNRALIEALDKIASNQELRSFAPIFDQVVFTAPDVDHDYFVDVLDDIKRISGRVTLYASENDLALQTSAVLHGAPRAGLAGESMITAPGLDTIDMSEVEADSLGHSYFAANEGAIYDLFRLLWRGEPPQERCGMREQSQESAGFWRFDGELCKGGEVLEAGLLIKRFGSSARERVRRRLDALKGESDVDAREEWSRILNRLERLLDDEND